MTGLELKALSLQGFSVALVEDLLAGIKSDPLDGGEKQVPGPFSFVSQQSSVWRPWRQTVLEETSALTTNLPYHWHDFFQTSVSPLGMRLVTTLWRCDQ